jgi:flavodoxin I
LTKSNKVLQEGEMEPFIHSLEGEKLYGVPMALFGSYDWGDGQWMHDWMERMQKQGALLVENGLTIQSTPNESGINQCRELGAKLASAIA